jgi:hypothetical protein
MPVENPNFIFAPVLCLSSSLFFVSRLAGWLTDRPGWFAAIITLMGKFGNWQK